MKPSLAQSLQPLAQRWARFSLRERLLVGLGGTALLLLAGDGVLNLPLEKRLKRERGQVQVQQVQLERARALAADGGAAAAVQHEQEARLQQRLKTAQVAAAALQQRAAESARLPETLRAITATVGSARLLALDLGGDANAAVSGASAPAGGGVAPSAVAGMRLYRLPITLKVSGSFEELQMLLTQIERHAEALQWSSLTLDSSDWPAIQLTVRAHVLSPDPRWGAAS